MLNLDTSKLFISNAIYSRGFRSIGSKKELQYAKNKFMSRATAIVAIGPRQIGKPNHQAAAGSSNLTIIADLRILTAA